MTQDIKRIDKAHARADEAVAQIKQGHLITSWDVLFEDENNGTRVTWTSEELENWESQKARMTKMVKRNQVGAVMIGPDRILDMGDGDPLKWATEYRDFHARARVMYPQSAAYLAVHPPADPYAGNREQEEQK